MIRSFVKGKQANEPAKKKFFHSISSEWIVKYRCWYRPTTWVREKQQQPHNSGALQEWRRKNETTSGSRYARPTNTLPHCLYSIWYVIFFCFWLFEYSLSTSRFFLLFSAYELRSVWVRIFSLFFHRPFAMLMVSMTAREVMSSEVSL